MGQTAWAWLQFAACAAVLTVAGANDLLATDHSLKGATELHNAPS